MSDRDLISRSALLERLQFKMKTDDTFNRIKSCGLQSAIAQTKKAPAVDAVEVVHGYHEGDVCIYGFAHENKSRAIVEIVRILNDERGVAEIKFHKVFVDDTGNGLFDYLLKSGKTMNASFKYLKNITPRTDGERRTDG